MHPQSLQEWDINLRMWVGVKKHSFTHVCPHTQTHKVFLSLTLISHWLCFYLQASPSHIISLLDILPLFKLGHRRRKGTVRADHCSFTQTHLHIQQTWIFCDVVFHTIGKSLSEVYWQQSSPHAHTTPAVYLYTYSAPTTLQVRKLESFLWYKPP